MINLVDEVGNALINDPALHSIVESRVHWIRAPDETKTPYITYFEVGNSEGESADDEEYADDIEIQVDIWTKKSTIPVAREVQRIMRELGFVHDAMPDMYEKDTGIIHKPIRFSTVREV